MIKQISLALVFTVASTTAAGDSQRADYQEPASKEENAGAISGAILGGLAGGPPGLILVQHLVLCSAKDGMPSQRSLSFRRTSIKVSYV